MRVAVRQALIEALNKTFCPDNFNKIKKVDKNGNKIRPYQFLMLGGDDILLLTRPQDAFQFLVDFAEELKKHPVPDEEHKPISIGAGVVIASHKLPFFACMKSRKHWRQAQNICSNHNRTTQTSC